MSYCGACGGFFHPGCPRAGEQGGCHPAPNPYEERAVQLFAFAVEINARVAGMVFANQNMMARQMQPPFGKAQFDEMADRLAKEVKGQ